MTPKPIQTRRLELVPQTLDQVRAKIDRMNAEERSQLSSDWLAQLDAPDVGVWTLGFVIVLQATGASIGSCGFKGPPGADGIVEIAYGVAPEHQGRGYATEAAEALVAYASSVDEVRLIRAHTLPQANASTRVLTKCGFHSVGEVVDPEDGRVWRWDKRPHAKG